MCDSHIIVKATIPAYSFNAPVTFSRAPAAGKKLVSEICRVEMIVLSVGNGTKTGALASWAAQLLANVCMARGMC
jgi:hypothetical protein